MRIVLMMAALRIPLCYGRLLLQNDNLSSFDSLIGEMGSRILLKEFGNYKCVVVLSDAPEDLTYLNTGFLSTIRVSLDSADAPVEHLLVSALDADCQGLVVRCCDATAGVAALFRASKLAIRRVNRRILVLPATHVPQINVSSIFSLRNIEITPDIVVARVAENTESFELVTLRFTGEDTWRDELVVARWSRGRGFQPPSADLYPDKLADLQGRRLALATFHFPPYVILDPDANVFDGIDTRIILEFFRKINATWRVLEDTMGMGMWGTTWENGTGIGILGAVAMDKADMAFVGLYCWYTEYRFVEFSRPYQRGGITCLVPRPLLMPGWQVPILPFSPVLWASVFCSVIFATAALYAVKKLSDRVLGTEEGSAGGRYSTVEDCFFRSVGLLVLQTPDVERRHTRVVGPTRHVLSWLLIAYLLITSSYGSGLSSVLTIPRYESPIDTVVDLHESGLEWAEIDPVYLNSIKGDTDKLFRDLTNRFRVLGNDVLRSRIATRDLAYAVERLPGGYYTFGDYIDEEAMSKWLRPMREDVYWEPVVLVVRKGWPFLEKLNSVVDRLFQAGIIRASEGQISRKWLAARVQLAAQAGLRSSTQSSDEPIKLQLGHVPGEFILLLLGLCLSLVALLLEVAVHRKTKSAALLEISSTIKITLAVKRS